MASPPAWFVCSVCERQPAHVDHVGDDLLTTRRQWFANEPGWKVLTLPGRNPVYWCPDHDPEDKQ